MNNVKQVEHIKNSSDIEYSESMSIEDMQRNRVRQYLEKILEKRKPDVLELNCGSGKDSLWLAKKSYSVTAVDASEQDIIVAETKKIIAGIRNLEFKALDFFKLHKELAPQQFDFVISNFGGLNTLNEPELKVVSNIMSRLLYPGGKMIVVMKGKYCLWETFYFMLKFKMNRALQRWDNKEILFYDEDNDYGNWFYSTTALKEIFAPRFAMVDVKPIAVAVPPTFMQNYFNKKPQWLKRLNKLDMFLTRFKWLSNYSDHLIITFELKDYKHEKIVSGAKSQNQEF
ncbi:MAG: class I SAM-dependent methyltransferase [Bacteroidia bacterium]|nr:class I SAM-dependent methyltransferase [Bacteroidia bacterium]MCZ2247217.1 class I SAM-dependent methyltransferase [Bacteroidia bacterium]